MRLVWKSAVNNFGMCVLSPGQNTSFMIFFNPLCIFYPAGTVNATKEKKNGFHEEPTGRNVKRV